jgi:ribosomal protein S27AE
MELHIQNAHASKLERDRILMKDKKYYEDKKEKISEKRKIKIDCRCGSNYNLSTKARHERTKKHVEYNVTLVHPCPPLVHLTTEIVGKTVILSESCLP